MRVRKSFTEFVVFHQTPCSAVWRVINESIEPSSQSNIDADRVGLSFCISHTGIKLVKDGVQLSFCASSTVSSSFNSSAERSPPKYQN